MSTDPTYLHPVLIPTPGDRLVTSTVLLVDEVDEENCRSTIELPEGTPLDWTGTAWRVELDGETHDVEHDEIALAAVDYCDARLIRRLGGLTEAEIMSLCCDTPADAEIAA